MAKVAITSSPRIVSGGGPITSEMYKSHATQLWEKNALLKLASGLLTPVVDTSGGSAEIDTDDTGTAGVRLFIALADHTTAGSVYVPVQEITRDTVLRIQLLASGATDPTVANVTDGTAYTGYQIDTGAYDGSNLWGIDVDDTTNPVFTVYKKVPGVVEPFTTDADYAFVYVKVLPAILA